MHAHPLPSPFGAFADEQSCGLLKVHNPRPVVIQHHHQKPIFLQNVLYGRIMWGPSLWVCSNCHDAIHAWLYWLLGEHREPPQIGYAAKAEANRTYAWYLDEKQRLGL